MYRLGESICLADTITRDIAPPRNERQFFDLLALHVWYGTLLLDLVQIYEGKFLLEATSGPA